MRLYLNVFVSSKWDFDYIGKVNKSNLPLFYFISPKMEQAFCSYWLKHLQILGTLFTF